MPHLISNLYEKSYTPFTAKLAPRNLWNRPQLKRQPVRQTRLGANPRFQQMWRLIRTWVTHNHKAYYTYVVFSAMSVYTMWWHLCIGYYRNRNAHRSIEEAIRRERLWEINKPPEDDDDDDEEEEEEGGEAAGGGGDGGEEEDE